MQQLIDSINYQDDVDKPYLLFMFKKPWNQDDIQALAGQVFNTLEHIEIIEHAHGADLETIHFRFNQHDFLLHFETYSQSCWIDRVTASEINTLEHLVHIIKSRLAKS